MIENTPNTEIKDEVKTEEKVIIDDKQQQPKTKVKVSNLVACPRCNRYMKQITLDFHHDRVCKARGEEFIPKALKNTKLKAENIKHIVKEAIDLIEKERPKKAETIVKEEIQQKQIIEEKPPIRTSSQPPIRKLETIQERTPTYADLRRDRIEKRNNTMSNLFMKAF